MNYLFEFIFEFFIVWPWLRSDGSMHVLLCDAYPPEGEAKGLVATLQSIKSTLALPWPASLPADRRTIRGLRRRKG